MFDSGKIFIAKYTVENLNELSGIVQNKLIELARLFTDALGFDNEEPQHPALWLLSSKWPFTIKDP
uniref:Uncharacterized protein n=1 Tax=Candidatus Kentrum sp. MB TaxID=2138164 RepID=A0A450XNT8_9GAMM|nr:MAG: hypothetical protein BECKMB1821G_GA0114241_10738 [Candidatus Kentron sp. MB]